MYVDCIKLYHITGVALLCSPALKKSQCIRANIICPVTPVL